ncbi:MmgE/PrpD family protein [Sphingomonas sp. CL5.1]|uniref:MmgE/PrpD family protein n=1 Tax=Sphingomonas sp. CL5.1 TaxID=2653203 RepID=UPI001583F88E|nr:MmgE/PrpD family protein [Sphingomonas sp. CL5.1]QKR99838.1 MmgE/PrpD family protein [Sphingomonas sp. CL5.1]
MKSALTSRRALMRDGATIALLAAWALPARAAGLAADGAQPLAERLARYAFDLSYADIDEPTLETLRLHLADSLGCSLGALDEPVVQSVYRVAASESGPATLIGTGQRTTAQLAAFANGSAIRFSDLNDGYAGKEIGHPSDLIGTCLAVAQAERRSVRDFIVATILVYEIECRLFDAAAISPRGWDHPTYSVVAAALAAGKLMGLSVAQLTEAVNLALVNHIAMNQTRMQVLSAWKALANPAAGGDGVAAARLARAGITGPSPIFEGDAGFAKMVVGGPFDVDVASFGGRGRRFRINDCGLKPFPAQGLTLTAVVAAISLRARIPDRGAIRSIAIASTRYGYTTAGKGADKFAPTTRETADHSLPYVVARALIDGEITGRSYAPDKLADPEARALMAKTTVSEDPALTAKFPRQASNRVTITLQSGEVLTEQVDDLPGSSQRPFSRAEVEAKFWRTVGPAISRARGRRLLDQIWALEKLPSVDALLRATIVAG